MIAFTAVGNHLNTRNCSAWRGQTGRARNDMTIVLLGTLGGRREMMKTGIYMHSFWLVCLILIPSLIGCGHINRADTSGSQVINSEQLIADLNPYIEMLYLNWHELDQVYKDIKFLERGFLFDPDDRQLGYIQKASLYIQDASVRIHDQWEHLSVLAYIRPERLRDYLTISVNGLTSAIAEIGYDEMFLDIYGSYISHDTVSDDLARARSSIKKNVEGLRQILQKVLPLANVAEPPTTL
jgi:hypothetical protein